MGRFFYALKKAWALRRVLAEWSQDPRCLLSELRILSPEWLRQKNVRILALDFDGVMASHGQLVPEPVVQQWLAELLLNWTEGQVVILSNKPLPERQRFFKDHFPKVTLIQDVRKKPYPDGLQLIQARYACPPENILLVDDRWLTGMLAAAVAGTQALYLKQPYVCYQRRPLVEGWFSILRGLERGYLYMLEKKT